MIGVSLRTIQRWESGETSVKRHGLIAIASACGVDAEWLEGPPGPPGGSDGGDEQGVSDVTVNSHPRTVKVAQVPHQPKSVGHLAHGEPHPPPQYQGGVTHLGPDSQLPPVRKQTGGS